MKTTVAVGFIGAVFGLIVGAVSHRFAPSIDLYVVLTLFAVLFGAVFSGAYSGLTSPPLPKFVPDAPSEPQPLTDEELCEWGLRLVATSSNPARLASYGIDESVICRARFDGEALAELRRWSGIPRPIDN